MCMPEKQKTQIYLKIHHLNDERSETTNKASILEDISCRKRENVCRGGQLLCANLRRNRNKAKEELRV